MESWWLVMPHYQVTLIHNLLPQLLMPVIANNTNHQKWPGVVSRDVMSHVGGLKGEVFTFSGQVKGKTLLPLPPQADAIVKASEQQARLGRMRESYLT